MCRSRKGVPPPTLWGESSPKSLVARVYRGDTALERSTSMAVPPLVMASILGTIWAWIVWIIIGGIAGAIADRLIQGNQLGILGNIIVGIIGGLLGGLILGLFGIDVNGWFWTFVTALVGAILLLLIVRALTGGRGVGNRR